MRKRIQKTRQVFILVKLPERKIAFTRKKMSFSPVTAEVHFAEVNKGGRGIRSGFGACWCDDVMQCTCGTSFRKPPGGKEAREASRARKERDRLMPQVVGPDARKGSFDIIFRARGSPFGIRPGSDELSLCTTAFRRNFNDNNGWDMFVFQNHAKLLHITLTETRDSFLLFRLKFASPMHEILHILNYFLYIVL